MCSAQPVIMAVLMWSLGGTEATYYWGFMTTFTLFALPGSLLYSRLLFECTVILRLLPPQSPPSPKPTFTNLSVRCLFIFGV